MQTANDTQQIRKLQTDNDIISIILEDHKPLKQLIKVMKDTERSTEERFAAFEKFAPTLIAHAKPEEETLYVFMKKNEELKEDGYEGGVEHTIADQLVEEIKRTSDEDMKDARIKVLAELVEHHIEEEEEELLPDLKKETEKDIRARIGNQFLELKIKYLAAGDENIIPDPKLGQEQQQSH
jgi:hemerythrin-like domain-containing protein